MSQKATAGVNHSCGGCEASAPCGPCGGHVSPSYSAIQALRFAREILDGGAWILPHERAAATVGVLESAKLPDDTESDAVLRFARSRVLATQSSQVADVFRAQSGELRGMPFRVKPHCGDPLDGAMCSDAPGPVPAGGGGPPKGPPVVTREEREHRQDDVYSMTTGGDDDVRYRRRKRPKFKGECCADELLFPKSCYGFHAKDEASGYEKYGVHFEALASYKERDAAKPEAADVPLACKCECCLFERFVKIDYLKANGTTPHSDGKFHRDCLWFYKDFASRPNEHDANGLPRTHIAPADPPPMKDGEVRPDEEIICAGDPAVTIPSPIGKITVGNGTMKGTGTCRVETCDELGIAPDTQFHSILFRGQIVDRCNDFAVLRRDEFQVSMTFPPKGVPGKPFMTLRQHDGKNPSQGAGGSTEWPLIPPTEGQTKERTDAENGCDEKSD